MKKQNKVAAVNSAAQRARHRLEAWLSDGHTRRSRGVVIAAAVGLMGVLGLQLGFGQPMTETEPQTKLIVKYKADADKAPLEQTLEAGVATIEAQDDPLNLTVIEVPEGEVEATMQQLDADPRVEYVERDAVRLPAVTRPNDPYYNPQWYIPKTKLDGLWDRSRGQPDIIIAVIDSGVNEHPELKGMLTKGYDMVNNDTTYNDEFWHGTVVAGTAAALTDNGVGLAGACWNCRIMPIKIAGADGKGSTANIARGIRYAVDNGADVINISYYGPERVQAEADAVEYARSRGVPIVACAGNNAKDEVVYPARHPNVIAVASTDETDALSSFSNFWPNMSVAAPGSQIVGFNPADTETYVYTQGTSFASPLVAGAIAVLRSVFPNASLAQLTTAITKNTDPCCGGKIPAGRLNVEKAFNYLRTLHTPRDLIQPTVSIDSPAANATVSGTTQVMATALDGVGVVSVEFRVGNNVITTDTTAPYSFAWDTTKQANSSQIVTARAVDAAGNVAEVKRTFTVNNAAPADTTPPTVSISVPAAGAVVSGGLSTVTAVASDNVGVTKVNFTPPGGQLLSDTVAPYSLGWNTRAVADGPQTLTVTAFDAAGNQKQATVNVTVQNGAAVPDADLNNDNKVNITDLSILLTNWGATSGPADINKSGKVDITDLSILLSKWTR